MGKPRWSNKWQGLSDMHAAKNAAAKITEESGMTVQNTASDAMTTARLLPRSSSPNQHPWMDENLEMLWLSLRESIRNRQQLYLQPLSSMQQDMNYQSQTYWEAGGFTSQEQTPSSSSTEDSTGSCAALKQGPLEVKGNLTPSILTGDQPTTPSTSEKGELPRWW